MRVKVVVGLLPATLVMAAIFMAPVDPAVTSPSSLTRPSNAMARLEPPRGGAGDRLSAGVVCHRAEAYGVARLHRHVAGIDLDPGDGRCGPHRRGGRGADGGAAGCCAGCCSAKIRASNM